MKLHFCIDPMSILVSHQTVPPYVTTKLPPGWNLLKLILYRFYALSGVTSPICSGPLLPSSWFYTAH